MEVSLNIEKNDGLSREINHNFFMDQAWLDQKKEEIAITDIDILSGKEKISFLYKCI